MHYPYNPGFSDPMMGYPSINAGASTERTIPVQNQAPLQPATPQPVQLQPATPQPVEPTPFPLVRTVEFTGPEAPIGSSPIPTVIPPPPHFSVPSNPLLPEEYKEILSYESLQYMNGFLRTQIGKECLVMMVLGASGNVISRLGYLIGVGVNYLLLQDPCSEEILVCDFYSVRMVQLLGKRCPVNLLI